MPLPSLVVVPFRDPGAGKTRLRTALDRDQRAALSLAMFRDVVVCLMATGLDEIAVTAGGRAAADAAERLGLRVVLDRSPGELNRALGAVTSSHGAGRDVLIVAADLPRLTPADLRAVLASDDEVVIAPTQAGGTGALLRRPGDRIATRFGADSARRHRLVALAAGAGVTTVHRDGFRHDVDTWSDVVALDEVAVGCATAEVLPRILGTPTRGRPGPGAARTPTA